MPSTGSLSVDWVLSIPSPSFNTIELGPLNLTLYGLMIGLGIIAATIVARPRSIERGLHPDTPIEIIMWVVPAGIIGARIYHLLTDWVPASEWVKIWNGGLGIPGGIVAGILGGLWFVRRRNLPRNKVLDALVPVVPLAQAIGRVGNWWNQELYGRPTDLPWGLEIDAQHRVAGYQEFETFHPTFLYEGLWNLGLVVFLVWLDRRRVLKPGRLLWVYAGGYAIGRLWIEALRIDNATELFGVRVNLWTMGTLLIVSLVLLSRSFSGQDDAASSLAESANDDYAEDRAHTSADEEE